MDWTPEKILSVLDRCCSWLDFPMLDNGYIYLAATRLSLYRSDSDWALVIEVFGFSPRYGMPKTDIYTFASSLHNRPKLEQFPNRRAYKKYLANFSHNGGSSVEPIEDNGNEWIDSENSEFVLDTGTYILRGEKHKLPNKQEYQIFNIELESDRVQVFEFCRYLAATARDKILATELERRHNILPEMRQILQLEDWNHPDLANREIPSESETFQQLAKVLCTGNTDYYNPTQLSNTDWRNWLEGGTL